MLWFSSCFGAKVFIHIFETGCNCQCGLLSELSCFYPFYFVTMYLTQGAYQGQHMLPVPYSLALFRCFITTSYLVSIGTD
uniref:Uncharacterized protein n=1 Tax=Anguilla anguilla TaxID=7936 RepID=A0A0E9WXD7_ANGAN